LKQIISLLFSASLWVVLSSPALSQNTLDISQADGEVGFSGKHAGMTFKGVFLRWNAQLVLPPSKEPFVNAEFELSSAETGDSIYDETLPEDDWFDVDNHPTGVFKSTKVTQNSQGYKVEGQLTLRGKSLPSSFLLIEDGNRLKSTFIVDRINYGIGVESDPDAEWVDRDIQLSLDIPRP
jgi:polyisoprenoid-binding protein YceI